MFENHLKTDFRAFSVNKFEMTNFRTTESSKLIYGNKHKHPALIDYSILIDPIF